MDHRFKSRDSTYKTIKENISDHGLSKDFLDMTTKVKEKNC